MNSTVKQIASHLNGQVIGDEGLIINHPAKIEEAQNGAICFLANMKYEEFLYSTNASAVIISENFQPKREVKPALILVKDPYSAFVGVLNHFSQQIFSEKGISDLAFIHPDAEIAEDVYIAPFVSIGKGAKIQSGAYIQPNCTIGDFAIIGKDAMIHSNVSIYHFCSLGDNVTIHANTVIGSDGFGFAPDENGVYHKVPQVGNVVIGNNVEIGANTTIDRATMGSTIIKDGVKIDNLVQIAHNVVIDQNTVIAAQAGISGSTKLGKNIIVGGQAGFVGHIQVADNTKINAKSGISKSVKEEGLSLSGSPAFNWRDELKSQMLFRKLPELEKRIRELENQIITKTNA